MKHYTPDQAVRSLLKKKDCRISGRVIKVLKGASASNDIGIGSWGKIHFLAKYHNYVTQRVKAF
jgi:hypothetical protein